MLAHRFATTGIVALIATVFISSSVSAQELCSCDCYWSSDCPNVGDSCNYGALGDEDTCWWRAPKPQGTPGAGCSGDYHDWGQCDGKCTSSSGRAFVYSIESRAEVLGCIALWADAFDQTAMSGGGTLAKHWVDAARRFDFHDEAMPYRLWRTLLEVIMLSRGPGFFVFPQDTQWVPGNVAVTDMSKEPQMRLNGMLAVNALLAEISTTGSGESFVAQMDVDALDATFLRKLCQLGEDEFDAGDLLHCVYQRIYNLGLLYRLAGTGGSASRGAVVPCRGCMADCIPDDSVNLDDLLQVIGDWGSTTYPAGDLDLDGIVDLPDLLAVIAGWGDCVDPSGVP